MKQGTLITKIVMALLFLALAAYLGVYAYRSFTDPFSSTLSYMHTVDDAVEATGWVVREEQPLPRQTGVVDILPEEGEKVAKGETVAVVYPDEATMERKNEIRRLELELEQLEYSRRQDSGGKDAAWLDQEILAAMIELRRATAAGDYTGLETDAMELKNLVFRRSYTYSNNVESVETINNMIETVSAQLSDLKNQTNRQTTGVTAPVPGTYSGQTDGMEALLTPEYAFAVTPSELDRLTLPEVVEDTAQTGKLITSSTWYFIVDLPQEEAERLAEGQHVVVRFSRDFSGDVEMTVEQIGEPENGMSVVVLSADRDLARITLLRRQTVEIIFESTSAIRIPKAALRLMTEEDGKQQTGVYTVVGAQAEWKPVSIVAEEEEFFLVIPAPFENEENITEVKKALRAGDEIIVTAENLYDGKVVR